jgi:acyl carrier protein
MPVHHYEDTYQKVIACMGALFSRDPHAITPTTTFNELGMDTLDFVELVIDIEDQFHCMVDDAQIEKMETVGQLVQYVHGIRRK